MGFFTYVISMNKKINTPLLDKINSSADLRKVPESQLEAFVDEIR